MIAKVSIFLGYIQWFSFKLRIYNEELVKLPKDVAALQSSEEEESHDDDAGEKLAEMYDQLQLMGPDAIKCECHILDRIISTRPYSSDPDDVDHKVSLLGAIIVDVVLDVSEIIDSLRRSWTNIGVLDIAHIHQNVFSIKVSADGAKTLLEEGPWHVENMWFSVVEWLPNLAVGDEHLHKVWYWVQISGLTYEMMNHTEAERIGRKIGTVLDLEKSKIDVCRRKFLRDKVLLDSRNPLPLAYGYCWVCTPPPQLSTVEKDDDKARWYNHYGPWMQKKPFVEEIVSWREEYELAPPQKRLHPYSGQIQHSLETADDTPRCKSCPETADDSLRCPLCGGNTRVRIHFVHDTGEDRPY
ncbi:hypothetical protein ACLB2K_004502 [Fragaria x ananassa]